MARRRSVDRFPRRLRPLSSSRNSLGKIARTVKGIFLLIRFHFFLFSFRWFKNREKVRFKHHKLENISTALRFMEAENMKLVNIGKRKRFFRVSLVAWIRRGVAKGNRRENNRVWVGATHPLCRRRRRL